MATIFVQSVPDGFQFGLPPAQLFVRLRPLGFPSPLVGDEELSLRLELGEPTLTFFSAADQERIALAAMSLPLSPLFFEGLAGGIQLGLASVEPACALVGLALEVGLPGFPLGTIVVQALTLGLEIAQLGKAVVFPVGQSGLFLGPARLPTGGGRCPRSRAVNRARPDVDGASPLGQSIAIR